LTLELRKLGLTVQNQVWLPVVYEGIDIEGGYRIDLLVEDVVVVELKVVDHILEIHKAQPLSYLKLSGKTVGLIINFNVVHLRDGIKRIVNSLRPLASSASAAVLVSPPVNLSVGASRSTSAPDSLPTPTKASVPLRQHSSRP
jgi:GxxExxY protein